MSVAKRWNGTEWEVLGGIGSLINVDALYKVTDLTSAVSDYALQVGETAKITYTNATSVPLHILCNGGTYEVVISGNNLSYGATGVVELRPNGSTYSGAFFDTTYYLIEGNNSVQVWMGNVGYISINEGQLIATTATICTRLASKYAHVKYSARNSSNNVVSQNRYVVWEDTSTAWTSLGTLVFGTAQSGEVLIRRIA